MVRLCEMLNCLPGPGGLFEQDSMLVWLMKQVKQADAEHAKLEEQRNKATGGR